MKKKSKNKKIKEIKLPMKFNVALEKFEPELPVRKTKKKFKLKINWGWIIIFIIIFLIISFWWIIFYPFD